MHEQIPVLLRSYRYVGAVGDSTPADREASGSPLEGASIDWSIKQKTYPDFISAFYSITSFELSLIAVSTLNRLGEVAQTVTGGAIRHKSIIERIKVLIFGTPYSVKPFPGCYG